jgi:DNA-3-methyladenine glycosylase II
MPVLTRSATLKTAAVEQPTQTKRKLLSSDSTTTKIKKSRTVNAPQSEHEPPTLVPAELSFSFTDAKRHLIGVDKRFEGMFEKMKCRPFENLERVHPFRYSHSTLFDLSY